MKNLHDIAFIVQARLNSQRVPQKMIRPFAGTTLFDIILNKLIRSQIIPRYNIFASVYEPELQGIAEKKDLNIYLRSHESANNDNSNCLNWDAMGKLLANEVSVNVYCVNKSSQIISFVNNRTNSSFI